MAHEASEKHKPVIDAFNFMSMAASKAQGPGCDEAFFDTLKKHRGVLGGWLEKAMGDIDMPETKTKSEPLQEVKK